MKKLGLTIFLFLGFVLISTNINAQNADGGNQNIPFKERIFLSGNFGLQFGNRSTFVEVSPLLGYMLRPDLVIGTGPVYRYWRINNGVFNFEDNQFGARFFSRYHFIENFFAHAEYEWLNLTDYRLQSEPRTNINSFLAGGGYIQTVGRSAIFVMILYNFTETELTPYQNPVIRAGFNIGL